MENEPIKDAKQIEFPITEIINKAMRQIKLTTDAIGFLYHARINRSPETVSPLPTDSRTNLQFGFWCGLSSSFSWLNSIVRIVSNIRYF